VALFSAKYVLLKWGGQGETGIPYGNHFRSYMYVGLYSVHYLEGERNREKGLSCNRILPSFQARLVFPSTFPPKHILEATPSYWALGPPLCIPPKSLPPHDVCAFRVYPCLSQSILPLRLPYIRPRPGLSFASRLDRNDAPRANILCPMIRDHG
jgi:hypothetical protein